MSVKWNLWHGCHKLSAGCARCYVYRIDAKTGRDASEVHKTADFDLPLRQGRDGTYKIPSGERVYTCFTSDFFLEEADAWRADAWRMMHERRDLHFYFVTKRIDRFAVALPEDWGAGYENVTICCTVENQAMADYRLPLFLEAPIRHREIICEPLLERIDLERWLGAWIEQVTVGGESGPEARVCDYDWVTDLRAQCVRRGVAFHFKQTGAAFQKDGRLYHIPTTASANRRVGQALIMRRKGVRSFYDICSNGRNVRCCVRECALSRSGRAAPSGKAGCIFLPCDRYHAGCCGAHRRQRLDPGGRG